MSYESEAISPTQAKVDGEALTTHVEQRRVLRDNQLPAVRAIARFLDSDETKGYVRMPTGTGKTVVFSQIVEVASKLGLKTLILTSRSLLVDQIDKSVGNFTSLTDNKSKLSGDLKAAMRKSLADTQVVTMTYGRFISMIHREEIDPSAYDLVILDEGHHTLGPKSNEAIKRCTNATQLAFTATPSYAQEKSLSGQGFHEIYNMSIVEAVEGGLLCPVSAIIAKTKVNLASVRINKTGEYNEEELAQAVNKEARNLAAVQLSQKEIFKDKQTIVYCAGIDHAEAVALKYQEAGINAAVISSRIKNKGDRRLLMDRYKRGEIKVLCNADYLIEGFDDPPTEVCINLRPTMSPLLAEQRAGRVLRLDPNNPGKHAYIIDLLDETQDPRLIPVTFAEVAGGSLLMPRDDTQNTDLQSDMRTAAPKSEDKGARIIERLRKAFEATIEGLEVKVDPEEVMRLERKIEKEKYPSPEEGEITEHGLVVLLGYTQHLIRKIIRILDIQSVGKKRDGFGMPREHYPPDTAKRIKQYIESRPKAPEDWLSVMAIARILGYTTDSSIRLKIKKWLLHNPDMGRYYLIGDPMREILYCHPDVLILFNVNSTPLTPKSEDYYSMPEIMRGEGTAGIHITINAFQSWIQSLDAEQVAGKVRKFTVPPHNTVANCYHISLIQEFLTQRGPREYMTNQGFITIGEAAKLVGVDRKTLWDRILAVWSTMQNTDADQPCPYITQEYPDGKQYKYVNKSWIEKHLEELKIELPRIRRPH